MAGNDTNFPNESTEIQLRAEESMAQINRLLERPVPALPRIGAFFAVTIPYGLPSFGALPSDIQNAAQKSGFQPICYIWGGHWPFPVMNTPQFVGPEGFVKLESYQAKHFYMRTLFTDGTAILTSNAPKGTGYLRTTLIDSVGDFAQDYATHLERVRSYMQAIDARPIYTPDRESMRASYAVVNRFQVPSDEIVIFLSTQSLLSVALLYLMYLLTR